MRAPSMRIAATRSRKHKTLIIFMARGLSCRKSGIGLDRANLENVPLLVRGHEQRPLIRIASLPLHVVVAEVVLGRPDVLEQSPVLCAVRLEASANVAQSLRDFRGD